MKSLISTVALLGFVLAVAFVAADDDESTTQKTFFGVNANDAEAMRQKHAELSEENAQKLFGKEHQLDQIDFTPDFKNGLGEHIKAAHEKFSDFIKKMLGAFFPNKSNQESNEGQSSNRDNVDPQNPEAGIDEIPSSTTTTTTTTTMATLMEQ